MPKNIFVDINIILDIVLQRPQYEASLAVVEAGETGLVRIGVSAHEVTTLDYLMSAAKLPLARRRDHLIWLIKRFNIVAIDAEMLEAAWRREQADFEDQVIIEAARKFQAEMIVTRNVGVFRDAGMPVIKPEQFRLSPHH